MSASRKRSQMVSLRLEPGELAAIQQAAKERGQSISQFLRDAAVKIATAPRCASCGAYEHLAWYAVRGGSVSVSEQPFAVTGSCDWAGWKCPPCGLRDHGFHAGSAA